MANHTHEKFIQSLTPEERMLLTLRDDEGLYNGSWDLFLRDLEDRLNGRPYIFKLVNRIQDDIKRIKKLRDYEKKNRIDLADYVGPRKEES